MMEGEGGSQGTLKDVHQPCKGDGAWAWVRSPAWAGTAQGDNHAVDLEGSSRDSVDLEAVAEGLVWAL